MRTLLVRDSGNGTTASWLSASIAVAGVVSFSLAVSTPPRTGPLCTSGCLSYPYAAGEQFVPGDFIWMYPAIVLVVLVVPLAAVISAGAPTPRKVWGPIALEDVGYIAMSLSFLAMAALVDLTTRLGRTVARVFELGGALTLILLILLAALYGADLEYRFEVYGLGVCWLVLVANGIMLSVLFRRAPWHANPPGRPPEAWAGTVRSPGHHV